MYGFPRCVKALIIGTVVAINKFKKNEEKKERKIDGKLRDIKGFKSIANSNLISHQDITG